MKHIAAWILSGGSTLARTPCGEPRRSVCGMVFPDQGRYQGVPSAGDKGRLTGSFHDEEEGWNDLERSTVINRGIASAARICSRSVPLRSTLMTMRVERGGTFHGYKPRNRFCRNALRVYRSVPFHFIVMRVERNGTKLPVFRLTMRVSAVFCFSSSGTVHPSYLFPLGGKDRKGWCASDGRSR